MNARDVMTSAVVSVGPDTAIPEIAKMLRDHGISAVPVIDATGAPSGMVSDGDLIGRNETSSNTCRDWWLTLLAEGETTLNGDFMARLHNLARRASEIMAAPVITVGEETEIKEIARLLIAHRIKRVPVLRDGRIVGIVSRADLVRALASETPKPADANGHGMLAEVFAEIDHRFLHRQDHAKPAGPPAPQMDDTTPTVSDFRSLVTDHDHKEVEHRQDLRRAVTEQRQARVAALVDQHITDENWHSLVHRARRSAESGEEEFMLLRFPSQLCSDGGRAINIMAAGWTATLRGEAAELYRRWERDLKPRGFPLGARVLDFPDGMPGDIGLFLRWAQ
jgi:CBS domain-containing protein